MRTRWAPPLALVVLLVARDATAARAGEEGSDATAVLPPIVVIASTPRVHPGSLFVLYSDTAPIPDPAALSDFLRLVPGAHVDRSAASGSISSLYLRGGDPNWTAVLVDGVRINDATDSRGGGVDLATIDPGLVERIEVIRGPASATIGSDAISGVVNITTRSPADATGASVAIEAGDRGAAAERVQATMRVADDAARVYEAALYDGRLVPGGALRLATLAARFDASRSDGHSLVVDINALREHAHAFPDDSGGPLLALRRDLDERMVEQQSAAMRFTARALQGLDLNLQATLLHRTQAIASPGVAPGLRDPVGLPASDTRTTYSRQTLRASGETEITPSLRVALGGEYARESGSSDAVLQLGPFALPTHFALSRTTVAAFAEARMSLHAVTVLAGARVDHTTSAGTITSPRLGAVYALDDASEWRASYGSGFKVPSFFALSHPIVGNPALVAERARSVDAGYATRFARGSGDASLTFFAMRVAHAIDFDPGPPPRLVNRSELRSHGVEATLRYGAHGPVSVLAQASFSHAEVPGSDAPLRNRPHVQGAVTLTAALAPGLRASGTVAYAGRFFDSSIPSGNVVLPSGVVVDAGLAYALGARARLSVSVTNLLDRRFQEAIGFPAPRRQIRAGLALAI
jgi:iron complex outermembrane receptor protein/vitamin B12 transporter